MTYVENPDIDGIWYPIQYRGPHLLRNSGWYEHEKALGWEHALRRIKELSTEYTNIQWRLIMPDGEFVLAEVLGL